MNKYDDLELSILSCFLQKPDLLKETLLEDKHFIKHQKIFIFFKSIYKKFGTLDINIMHSVSKNKYRTIEYIVWILNYSGFPSKYKLYEKQLIDLFEEEKKNRYIKEEVYKKANDLLVGNIEVCEFQKEISSIYNNAERIFKE